MNKKIYNFHTEFSCFAVIKPLTPRFSALDGVMSVLNITGDYYRVDANIKNLCKASERITKLNDVCRSSAGISAGNRLQPGR